MAIIAYLEGVTGELFGAEFAARASLCAGVLEMILHENTGYHSPAFVVAGYGVVLARVEMSFELSQFIGPFAAVFVMDAVDDRSHYCLLGLEILEGLKHEISKKILLIYIYMSTIMYNISNFWAYYYRYYQTRARGRVERLASIIINPRRIAMLMTV